MVALWIPELSPLRALGEGWEMEAKIDAKGLNELYLEELVKDCRGTPVEPNMETAHCKDKEE